MEDYKIIIGILAVMLTFIAYIPYIRDIIKNKTTPHAFTWFVFGVEGAIAYALQVYAGAGYGAWTTLVVAVLCFLIFLFSIYKKNQDIIFLDAVFLIASFFALFLWFAVKQPIWSVILIVIVSVLGFVPTIRKCWNNPYSETIFLYEANFIRNGLAILALAKYNIITCLYPATWALINLLFVIFIIKRKKYGKS